MTETTRITWKPIERAPKKGQCLLVANAAEAWVAEWDNCGWTYEGPDYPGDPTHWAFEVELPS